MEAESFDCQLNKLCSKLSGDPQVNLPTKLSEDGKDLTNSAKCCVLQQYFKESPLKFIQRYHKLMSPSDIACFNYVEQNEYIAFYIRKICHRKDIESRMALDHCYVPQLIKNRRYQAMQNLIKDGEYFSEKMMEKRNPKLYEQYIGRYLTRKEKEERLKVESQSAPTTLSDFFMEVIDKKQEQRDRMEQENKEEEFESDSSDEEEEIANVTKEEKESLKEEFLSAMYQSFLDGRDRDFAYKDIDENGEYDNLNQMEQDEQDEYFDEEEPSSVLEATSAKDETSSEDELDKFMKSEEFANVPQQTGENQSGQVT